MTHDDIVPALEIYGKSDGYGANYCHSMIRIRAHRGHEIECQMVSNEAIWLFRCLLNRHHKALSPVGETVPSRRHNLTDSESGKKLTRLVSKMCQPRLLFSLLLLHNYFVCFL